MKKQTFKKEERLSSKLLIEDLFNKGARFNVAPFQVVWIAKPDKSVFSASIVISVPKKKIKLAVNRNLVKRRVREAYRINKDILYSAHNDKERGLNVMFIYTANKPFLFNDIESKIILILQRLVNDYSINVARS